MIKIKDDLGNLIKIGSNIVYAKSEIILKHNGDFIVSAPKLAICQVSKIIQLDDGFAERGPLCSII